MKLFNLSKPVETKEEKRFHFPSAYNSFSSGDLIPDRASISSVRLAVIYGCVSLIAGKISCLPITIIDNNGTQIVEGEPRPRWIDYPDPNNHLGMSRSDLLTSVVVSLLLDGTAFLAVGRDSRGRVVELACLSPYACDLRREKGVVTVMVDGRPPPFEVCVLRNIVLPGYVRGVSPIDAARATLDVAYGVQEQSARFFDQGAVLAGVITTNERVGVEDAAEIAKAWQQNHAGAENAHLPVILQAAKYEPISVTPEAAQFLETRKFTDAQIAAQLFHVDPTLLGIEMGGSSLTYENVGQRNRQLMEDALLPIMRRIEHCMSGLLPMGKTWRFDTAEFLRSDPQTRYNNYLTAAKVGQTMGQPLMTVDEMRTQEGLPLIDDKMPVVAAPQTEEEPPSDEEETE